MSDGNRILEKMLDRLLAALVNGPGLNCRPHASRQRLDLTQFTRLNDLAPDEALRRLLGEGQKVAIKAKTPAPKTAPNGKSRKGRRNNHTDGAAHEVASIAEPTAAPSELAADQDARPEERAWNEQRAVLNKIRTIAEDARTYEQDTGVSVLNIGFPLLSLPPGSFGGGATLSTRRVLAPVAFIPVSLALKQGATPLVELSCRGEGIDRVTPNVALLAWIEQQTGKSPESLDADEEGRRPWHELRDIVRFVCDAMDVPVPREFAEEAAATPKNPSPSNASTPSPGTQGEGEGEGLERSDGEDAGLPREVQVAPESASSTSATEHTDPVVDVALTPAPRAEESDSAAILCSAVLGLFPMANQGLLRDTQAMLAGEGRGGPVESFLQLNVSLEQPPNDAAPHPQPQSPAPPRLTFSEERFVSAADPCQARAVRLARQAAGLVVHGPPGTGKSQTITNIVGDHLARGQRVLIVCDKRTALDVVINRLEHMGLGRLCALVYDPRRDQRELYKCIREQLDELPEVQTDDKAETRLGKVDRELEKLHDELTSYRGSLMDRPQDHSPSFHELVGQWLALVDADDLAPETPASANIPAQRSPGDAANGLPLHGDSPRAANLDLAALQSIGLHALDEHSRDLSDLLKRAHSVSHGSNPWAAAAGIPLSEFLSIPMDRVRAMASSCANAAQAADETLDSAIPPFAPDVPLAQQAAARGTLAGALEKLLPKTDPAILWRWADADGETLRRSKQKLSEAQPLVQIFRGGPLDAELALIVREQMPGMAQISEQLATLASYLQFASKWYAFLPLKPKSQAAKVLTAYGLTLSIENATRLQRFLTGLRARLALQEVVLSFVTPRGTGFQPVSGTAESEAPFGSADSGHGLEARATGDETLDKVLTDHAAALDFLLKARSDAALTGLAEQISKVLKQPAAAAPFLEGMRKSVPRAQALQKLEEACAQSRLFDAKWLQNTEKSLRAGAQAAPIFLPLASHIETFEGVLRVRQELAALAEPLQSGVRYILAQSLEPDRGMAILRRETLAGEITRRLKADPRLQETDGHRLNASFDRYRERSEKKPALVRDAILHRWVSRQKERLLASTGSRMNTLGADLRRRLMLRGERAMRLRQVVAVGAKTEGGDPLFDLCPVWLCSPETVAQVFPRQAIFDAVVFDEASQCRLEEAIPVIVRGKGLVIAGDPKQLPPTRFFESAIATSDEDEAETDQELFEQHQGEVEDLLGAALGLDIQQSYLDVHYRSRNADLIAFSNENFYGSRLQPIPGHPSRADEHSPVSLERVEGIYEKRRNEIEARRVCEIVKELVERDDPPSIGIACFNLPQRDLIVETLDEMAAEDSAFARKLEQARTRQGAGSFEGLFVKNLENVQGDERDHILISTTYGPDAKGRFYRRFGPLGQAGGGRRLNVLITRARQQVHIITSIPQDAYRTFPELPPGQTPGGGWLLLAYLNFAEKLQELYAKQEQAAGDNGMEDSSNAKTAYTATIAPKAPEIDIHPTKATSLFAEALARRLAEAHGVPSDVYWGNEGFCVDLALHAPDRPRQTTAGVLCDASRFAPADDPTEWDVFRTAILQSQGWDLRRIWTPHFFRDPRGVMRELAGLGQEELKSGREGRKPNGGCSEQMDSNAKTP